jgi:peptide deformylase
MIITNNEAALRIKCTDATSDEVGTIIDQLERELEHSARLGRPGVGLAAPQCGIAKNVAIVRINNQYRVNLVNCKIERGYDKTIFKEEGCLSFPNRIENTMRYQEIYVKGNLQYPNNFIASGFVAVVCQHEIDHINGILLPDNAIKQELKTKTKIRPNDLCFCGSKIKFKRCHGVKI